MNASLFWQCQEPECLWASVHPLEHPCPFPMACLTEHGPAREPHPETGHRAQWGQPSTELLQRVLIGLQQLDTSGWSSGGVADV